MKKKILSFVVFSIAMLVLGGCSLFGQSGNNPDQIEQEISNVDIDEDGTGDITNPETMSEDDYMDLLDANNELMEETAGGKRIVRGSCNVIAESSTCMDYIGSYWDTPDVAALNCGGVGVYSKNTCPYTRYGGCKTGAGTIMEMIAWAYPEGGGGYNDENIQYAVMACNALVNATWTTPDAEFLQ